MLKQLYKQELETKTIYIKGTNDVYKKPILFKCICKIEGDKLLLGKPFLKGSMPIAKFKNNSEENPFNYMIAIDTYEKAINKENPLKEFYDYHMTFIEDLERNIKGDCESIDKDISTDYKSINFKLKDNRAISSLRLNLNRRTITKFNLSFENPFTRERDKTEYTNKDFNQFKEKLKGFKEIILKVIKESKKENPYFKKVLEFINSFEEYQNTDFYNISLRCNEFLDRLSIYFKLSNYQIPIKSTDSIEKYKTFSVNIEENDIYLQNGSNKIKEEYLNSFDKLKEFILKEIGEIKKSKISKVNAREILNNLKNEQEKKDKLTEEKFKDFCERFKEEDKITIYGVEGMWGGITLQGRIHNLDKENKTFFVIAKGKQNRGKKFNIGSYYKNAERGYL